MLRYKGEEENTIFFPGSEEADCTYIGEGKGEGRNINIALKCGKDDGSDPLSDSDYWFLYEALVRPAAAEYQPDLVLIAGGYDACAGDIGGYNLSPAIYGHMTQVKPLKKYEFVCMKSFSRA